mmetsp:Transcript_75271/g.220703  ORF Transcript_75271/g.220703 Transcript_75271/m.220703 type:complete len:92 (-) Transcript_75271:212-487(-)
MAGRHPRWPQAGFTACGRIGWLRLPVPERRGRFGMRAFRSGWWADPRRHSITHVHATSSGRWTAAAAGGVTPSDCVWLDFKPSERQSLCTG